MRKFLGIAFAIYMIIVLATPIHADSQANPFPNYKEWILDQELDWDKDTIIQWYVDKGTVVDNTWTNMIMATIKKSKPNLAVWIVWSNKEGEEIVSIVFRWNPESKSYKFFVDSR